MGQSRRNFLEGLAATGYLAAFSGCIEIEIEREKDYHGGKGKGGHQDTSSGSNVGDELEPGKDTDVGEELEDDSTEEDQETVETADSSACDWGYIETYLTLSEGETVRFEEPSSVTGGEFSVGGHLTNEGDRVRVQYGPSVLYLDHKGETDFFSFEQGPFPEWGYGDHDGRYFGLHEYENDEAVVATGLIYDKWGPNRREAIGVCIDL